MEGFPEIRLKDYAGKGEYLLETYRHRVSASPASKPAGSAFDESKWHGVNPALDRWHDYMTKSLTLDDAGLDALLPTLADLMHNDVVFHPPTYWRTREGKDITMWILRQVSGIFGKSFSYQRQLVDASATNVMLEFSCMVDEIPAQGVDIITFDSNGPGAKIVDFKVMLRPPEATLRLKQHMDKRALALMGVSVAAAKAKL